MSVLPVIIPARAESVERLAEWAISDNGVPTAAYRRIKMEQQR